MKIDYTQLTHDELDQRGMEMLALEPTEEIIYILKCHLLIERVLEALISKELKHPDRILERRRLTFDVKIDLADALGCLPAKHLNAVKTLNKIRNAYAHNDDYVVKIADLNALKIEWEPIQNKAYAVAKAKGLKDAVQIATIFLHWSFIHLLSGP